MDARVDRERRFEVVAAEVYEPLQRYFGRRVGPDDVSGLVNDALLVIWRRLDDVPILDVRPWSYGVARRCLANHRRGDRRRQRLVRRVESHATVAATSEWPAESGIDDVEDLALGGALDALDERDRELIRLWAWEQLEPREIAVVLDTTANAVSLRLARVRRKLHSAIERQNSDRAGHEGFGHGKEVGS